MPRTRNPAGNVLLFLITLGVYWLIWIHWAFRELAEDRRARLRAATWTAGLAVLYPVGVLIALVYWGVKEGNTRVVLALGEVLPSYTSVPLTLAVVGIAYCLLQFEYLLRCDRMARAAATAENTPAPPRYEYIFAFNVLLALAALSVILDPPLLVPAGVALIAVLVGARWSVAYQDWLNAYWDARDAKPEPAPRRPAPTFEPAKGVPPPPRPPQLRP